jgi:hypothetical protein
VPLYFRQRHTGIIYNVQTISSVSSRTNKSILTQTVHRQDNCKVRVNMCWRVPAGVNQTWGRQRELIWSKVSVSAANLFAFLVMILNTVHTVCSYIVAAMSELVVSRCGCQITLRKPAAVCISLNEVAGETSFVLKMIVVRRSTLYIIIYS